MIVSNISRTTIDTAESKANATAKTTNIAVAFNKTVAAFFKPCRRSLNGTLDMASRAASSLDHITCDGKTSTVAAKEVATVVRVSWYKAEE